MIIEKTGKVTQKGQVTIPIRIRNMLNIEEGDQLKLAVDDKGVLTGEVIKRKRASEVYGILGKPPKNADLSFAEIRELARNEMIKDRENENSD